VLTSNNLQTAHAERRSELNYEESVRTFRTTTELDRLMKVALARLDRLKTPDEERGRG
jgi:hypothetical protein